MFAPETGSPLGSVTFATEPVAFRVWRKLRGPVSGEVCISLIIISSCGAYVERDVNLQRKVSQYSPFIYRAG